MKIGFIGLGNMGAPMASNLVHAGFQVIGFDIAGVYPEGVPAANSVQECSAGRDVVITMLPNGQVLRDVASQAIAALVPGNAILDCTTADIESTLAVAAEAEAKGIDFVDAPVSGGVAGAENAKLTIMAGGRDSTFARLLPILQAIGRKAVHCGGAGSGQAAKICNNMICGATMIVACEAFALADRLGLNRKKLFDVVSTSSGSCWAVNTYCPAPNIGPHSPADNDYKPGFASELMLKDLRLAQQAASTVNASTPIGSKAAEVYESFVREGGKGLDFSAILRELESGNRY